MPITDPKNLSADGPAIAARHRQPIELLQQGRNLRERKPELFVEDHHQHDHLGTELCSGGADRVGRLQRMTTLHASAAPRAPAHVQIKLTDDQACDRELFLILRRDGRFQNRIRSDRTRGRPSGPDVRDSFSAILRTAPPVGSRRAGRRSVVV
jgi:hypothetical protein